MAVNITMPALSPTMEEGNLAKWLVKEGDAVSAGDVIAEIETDKATMEVEAVDEGVIAKLMVEAGSEGVKVNAVIAVLAEEGEEVAKVSAAAIAAPVEAEIAPPSAPAPVAAVASAPPEQSEIKGANVPSGNEKMLNQANSTNSRILASPLARRIAKNAGIDLASVTGSGPNGRIIQRDVENLSASSAASAPGQTTATSPSRVMAGPSDEQTLQMFAEGSYELVPHDNIRRIIASRLVQSKQTVPHFYLNVECQIDALLDIRAQINAAAPMEGEVPTYKISVNDMIIKAMALALRDVPDANVSWTEENMVRHKHSDVGVAVSIPGGLITPIVRNAEEKPLSQIANEMKDLAARARTRKLKPQEYQGGSTAVSNLGMFGIREFAAVINPPQATILAVGAGEKRPIVANGEIKAATIMAATLSTDHRAVDGVLGAQLLGAFKRYIEAPVSMLV